MAKIITEDEIKKWINKNEIILNGDLNCAEGIKYDFRLGTKFLKAYFGREVDYEIDLKTAEDRRKAVVDPGYEGFLVFGLRNVAGTPFTLTPGIKIVGANFFELSSGELSEANRKPESIEGFPTKLLDLIEKYKPVNPQNLADELRKLQKAFEDSQGQLVNDVGELKEKVNNISQELLIESTKREQENKALSDKFINVENKLENITRDNIRHEESLNSIKEIVRTANKSILEINENIISNNTTRKIKEHWVSIIITFFFTFVAGIIVALFQGWIG